VRGRRFSRFACGFAPAFGRAVRALRGLVYGTAEAVPLRGLWGERVEGLGGVEGLGVLRLRSG